MNKKKVPKTKISYKLSIILLILALIIGFAGYKLFLQPAWYVEDDLIPLWRKVIKEANLKNYPIYLAKQTKKIKPGIIITYSTKYAEKEPADWNFSEKFPKSYNLLLEKGIIGNTSIPLLADPWLIARKLKTKSLGREDFTGGNKEKILIAALKEEKTYQALLAEAAYFSGTQDINSEEAKNTLQRWEKNILIQGAKTFNSNDAWSIFFREDKERWLFTSLSSVSAQDADKTGLIALDRFPDPYSAKQYLLPIRILWAHSTSNNTGLRKLLEKLSETETQEVLAKHTGLVPANIKANPANPPAMQAKRAWLSSTHLFLID
ncbi:hypothetical protein WKV44_00825 [Spirochaetia bacterium 38H-sp]|uniref:Uncharacterized protein n=1 Tax=Rarispira pelagica TaxID=3141764 RepID=A0ABU9UAS2_9SPIR